MPSNDAPRSSSQIVIVDFRVPGMLERAWAERRAGKLLRCRRDAGPIVLTVAMERKSVLYLFQCASCSTASSWFRAGKSEMVVGLPPASFLGPEAYEQAPAKLRLLLLQAQAMARRLKPDR